jgi:hypothetical protein
MQLLRGGGVVEPVGYPGVTPVAAIAVTFDLGETGDLGGERGADDDVHSPTVRSDDPVR